MTSFREKCLSIGVIGRRSGSRVREFRRPDGVRCKATTDEVGNTTTEHAAGDRVDVRICAPSVSVRTVTTETRD